MKTKAAVLHSNHYIVLAFIAALLAFVFAPQANARTTPRKPLSTSRSSIQKKPVKSVMFVNRKQRSLLAQNTQSAAVDAKLEGAVVSDSIPVAAPSTATSALATNLEKQNKSQKNPHFGGSIVIGTYQSNTAEGRQSYSGSYLVSPSFKIPKENISLVGSLEYNREYSYELDDGKDGDWGNAGLALSKKVELGGLVDSVRFGPRVSLGMGNESRRQTYKGALAAGVSLDKSFGFASVAQAFSYAYRHFEYDIRDNGTVNSPHGLEETTSIVFHINDWMTVQASFGLSYLKSFQGVNRTFSTTAIGADFALSENATLVIGAATLKKNTLEPSGQNNRVKLWDKTDAVASIEFGLSI